MGSDSAHIASDSDCFSKATVSTRSWMPACTSWLATMRGRAADAARGVHPEQRLARRAERVGQVQLGHHHALEEVGRLADHDGVDVGPGHLGVGQRTRRRLPDEPGHRHVAPGGLVLGLADPDDRDPVLAHQRPLPISPLPARTPGSAAGTVPTSRGRRRGRSHRSGCGCATSPMRMRPAVIIGLAASAPPDGLISTSSPRPSAERRISSWWVNGACSSATCTGPSPTPAFSAASAGRRRVGEVAHAEGHRLDAVVDAA